MTTTIPTSMAPAQDAAQSAIDNDPIVVAIREGADLQGRLRACQVVIAEQAAILKWLELNPNSVDDLLETGRAISRRVRAVKGLVELELRQQRHASTEQIDLTSPEIRRVFDLLVDTIEAVTNEMVPTDTATEVIAEFRSKVEANRDIPWP